ncbi:hypothetical protein OHA99_26745 [Streptomyces coelicoflavus]|uniref:hypothetical protein n=1 Tax=Streptomyces coelicoflavus TaxID=285562 RepID=UPI00324C565A
MAEKFQSKILNIIPAHPDLYLRTKIIELFPDKSQIVTVSDNFRIIAWATVERYYPGDETNVDVEAVFVDSSISRPVHETSYRYVHSELNPEPGEPKVMVAFEYDLTGV